MKLRLLMSCILVVACSPLFSQFTTVTVNGSVSAGEYGASNTTGNIYLTWDNTNLYVGMASAAKGEAMVIYLDKDVLTPINGGGNSNGTNVGQNYDGTSFAELPFRADFVCYVKDSYREYRTADGSNSWSAQTTGFGTYADDNNNTREIAIPWSAIGGRPSAFAFFAYATSSGGFVYNQYPTENAGGPIGTSARYVRYFVVNSTADGSSTAPFSRNCYVFNSTTDVTVGDISVYDFTMNTTTRTITKGATANWTIAGTLSVGNGSINFGTSTGTCDVSGSVNVSGGTLDLNDKKLKLSSTAAGTAYIAAVTGSVSNATNVTVERYIPAKRAWRFLTAPLTGSSNNSIYYNWQNNGTTGSGVELWTTSANGGSATPSAAASGLAAGAGNSILSYNNGWTTVTNSKTTNLFDAASNNAYCVFVTGPFQDGAGNISTGSTATTLSATGTLRTGNTTISLGSLAADQFALVGNPFASPVDPTLLSGTNLKTSFWMWDPNLAGTYGVGGYVTFDRTSNQYNITTASYSNSPTSQIQSGQAFLVRASAAAVTNILFEETDKSTTVNNAQFRGTASGFEQLRFTLQKDFNSNNSFTSTDAAVAVFHATKGDKALDQYDVSKLNNSGENIALVRSAANLTFEYHPLVTSKDTLYLKIWNTTTANYRLVIEPQDIVAMSGATAVLKDNYLNTETALSLTHTTTINFSVDGNAASTGDRFMVYFTPPVTLPVDFISVQATPADGKMKIAWTVNNEKNISSYSVERSNDGKSFTAVGTVQAGSGTQYNFIDPLPGNGTLYYRIKCSDVNAAVKYSAVVRVNTQKSNAGISIYPNPVIGRTFDVTLSTDVKGTYQLRLFNATGQQVLNKTFTHQSGTTVRQVKLDAELAAGIYRLQVQQENEVLVQSIIIR